MIFWGALGLSWDFFADLRACEGHPVGYKNSLGYLVTSDGFRPFSRICDVVDLHHSITTKGLYKNPDNMFFHWVNTMIGNVKRAIYGTYHSISSKHLLRYLAEFSFQMGSMIDAFIKQAVLVTPLPRYKLKLVEEWGESEKILLKNKKNTRILNK